MIFNYFNYSNQKFKNYSFLLTFQIKILTTFNICKKKNLSSEDVSYFISINYTKHISRRDVKLFTITKCL